ncbi:MAG TPA: carboxypeptidase-like regulatory domain-containing protein [Vicinamibacteria bacterium]|nr:carboxypeptidase-like regulatory domain-containing protein [Vicinamibacteria bacterium]
MKNWTKALSRIAMALTMIGLAALASAQMTRGSLGGTVRDDTGGVLPGVSVTITNEDTGIVRTW